MDSVHNQRTSSTSTSANDAKSPGRQRRRPGTARRACFSRLSGPLRADRLPRSPDVRQRNSAAEDAIRRIFATTPDVPINRESLAGLVLGVMYSHRHIPADGKVLAAIMAAACLLADQSDAEPIRSDGPGLW